MSLTISGTAITTPNSFSITPTRIERKDRTADGTLVIDIIARKNTYTLGYDYLIGASSGSEIKVFTDLYNADAQFTFTYTQDGATVSKTCWISDIQRELYSESPVEAWQNISITLEEI